MAKELKPLSYAHLHAFVDKELIKQRRVDVAEFVKSHPELLIHIREYQLINNQLHTLFDMVLSEPVPNHLLTLIETGNAKQPFGKKRRRNFRENILIIVITGMACGGIVGVLLHFSYKLNLFTKTLFAIKLLISRLM